MSIISNRQTAAATVDDMSQVATRLTFLRNEMTCVMAGLIVGMTGGLGSEGCAAPTKHYSHLLEVNFQQLIRKIAFNVLEHRDRAAVRSCQLRNLLSHV